MKTKLNRTAKQAFFTARKREGDAKRLSKSSGYSLSHVINVIEGRRNVPQILANEMYKISKRRWKTIDLHPNDTFEFIFEF